MAKYSLIYTASNEIINIIELDSTASFSPPSGYSLSLYTTSSYMVSNISESKDHENSFAGDFKGTFSGELNGSITVNGNTIEYLLDNTPYGILYGPILSSSLTPPSASFVINSTSSITSILLSLTNHETGSKQKNYTDVFNDVITNNKKNYILRLKRIDGLAKREYLVKNTINSGSYVSVDVEEIYTYTDDSLYRSGSFYTQDFYTNWYVDFDLGQNPISSQVYVNGDKLEKTLNKTDFGMLRYDGYSQNVTQSSPRTYFRFNSGSDDYNGSYYWWDNVSPTKIVLSEYSLWYDDETYVIGDYRDKLEYIIKNKLEDSVLTLRQVELTKRYKSFKIKSGSVYERGSRIQSPTFYASLGWGSASYELIDGSSKFSHLGQVSPGRGTDPYEWDGYFYLEVEQIATDDSLIAGVDSGDPFFVDILTKEDLSKKRKEIHVLTSSIAFTIPDWVDDITMYAVGAGGGGGGGSNGYGHSSDIDYVTPDRPIGYEFVIGGGGGAGGSVSISKFNTTAGVVSRGDVVNIFVGSGGDPGSGSRFADEIPTTNNDRELHERRLSHKHPIVNSADDEAQWLKYFNKGYTPSGSLYNGKKGSSTQVFSATGDILISADGGYGGVGGYGLHGYYPQFHRLCGKLIHNAGDYYVPGGGSSIKKSVGNEIRPGGHGGYGIAMPSVQQIAISPPPFRDYPTVNRDMKNLNVAPNIPWDDKTNKQIYSLKLPYGHTSDDITNDSVLTVTSTLKPTQLAPGGGGGGTGITWQGIDTRNFNDNAEYLDSILYHSQNIGWPNDEVPNDFCNVTAARISGSQTFGYGGKYVVNGVYNVDNTILFDDYDSDGARYTVRVGSGANGGSSALTKFGTNLPNVNKSGSISQVGYGWGGGGGAATYIKNYTDRNQTGNEALYPTRGQNGGKGGDGVLILVLEQK